ncbi:MAG: DNA-methyltransferase [Candidatus Thorarchaeota archaeon]
MTYHLYCADAFEWMGEQPPETFHAIVTDPPYGIKEYTKSEIDKMRKGRGGVWRIPPSFDGATRRPLPRFTVLDDEDMMRLESMFERFGREAARILVPGAHVIVASNTLLFSHVVVAMKRGGLEFRGAIARLVRTLRGGDRPKNGHKEFSMVSSAPRSCWEPWLIFRKPLEGTLVENLRKWGTGGLRRISSDTPFLDVVEAGRTPAAERAIADHPSLKPQKLMRFLVRAVLPLQRGVILDPFMGAGSTIAAAEHLGFESVGVEIDREFFEMAETAIPQLAALTIPEEESFRGDAGTEAMHVQAVLDT